MKPSLFPVLILAGVLSAPALAQSDKEPQTQPQTQPSTEKAMPEAAQGEPDHIKVQHILISFKGRLPGRDIARTQDEAKELAYSVFQRAQDGEDYDALVKEYTDDQAPGIYAMSNKGVTPGQGEYPRTRMVGAFGNVGFVLEVGEIGIADFDLGTSPYGWHIVKRIE